MPRSSASVPSGRAEPAPPRGDHPRVRWFCGGRPGDGARGGFLGGARSPRPRGKDGCKARHNIIIGGKGTPGGLMGPSLGESEVSLTGVRSPPLQGASALRMALRGGPGDNAKGTFLGGTHSVRPRGTAVAMRRHLILGKGLGNGRWSNGDVSR